jgi:hypothetical protein
MASQTREQTHDEELDKILNKGFDDIRRRVNALLVKREKKLLRDMKASSKKPRENQHRETQNRDAQPKRKEKGKDKEYHRSNSSSDSQSD